jgi:hypothetical protein
MAKEKKGTAHLDRLALELSQKAHEDGIAVDDADVEAYIDEVASASTMGALACTTARDSIKPRARKVSSRTKSSIWFA